MPRNPCACIDIYSATMRLGKFEVAKDWGLRPVFKPDGSRVQPNDVDQWGDARKTWYRLRESDQ